MQIRESGSEMVEAFRLDILPLLKCLLSKHLLRLDSPDFNLAWPS